VSSCISTTRSCFSYLGFDEFKLYSFVFSWSTFTRSSRSFSTYPLDLKVWILFDSLALWDLGVSDSYALISPGVPSLELHGFRPCVPLQWTIVIFFSLCGFRSLSHSLLGNLQSSFPQSLRYINTYLLLADGHDLLRVFT
jgi:hypothetical protein